MKKDYRDAGDLLSSMERRITQAIRSSNAAGAVQLAERAEEIRNDLRDLENRAAHRRVAAAPVEITYETRTYLSPWGRREAEVSLQWRPVTLGIDGNPISVARYEVWGLRVDNLDEDELENPPKSLMLSVTDPQGTRSFLVPGATYEFQVRAISLNSVVPGRFSSNVRVTMMEDTTPPPIPSPLELTSKFITVRGDWDGLPAVEGLTMPDDFSHTEVAGGILPDPTKVIAKLDLVHRMVITDEAAYGRPYYMRHRSVDTSGNKSAWSEQREITPEALVDEESIAYELQQASERINTGLNSAYEQAQAAAQLANQARTAADGKTTIVDSLVTPSGSWPEGTIWHRYNNMLAGRKLIGSWTFVEGSWKETGLDPVYIPKIDIGQGTFGDLDGGRLKAQTIQAQHLAVGYDYTNIWSDPAVLETGRVNETVMAPLDGVRFTPVEAPSALGTDKPYGVRIASNLTQHWGALGGVAMSQEPENPYWIRHQRASERYRIRGKLKMNFLGDPVEDPGVPLSTAMPVFAANMHLWASRWSTQDRSSWRVSDSDGSDERGASLVVNSPTASRTVIFKSDASVPPGFSVTIRYKALTKDPLLPRPGVLYVTGRDANGENSQTYSVDLHSDLESTGGQWRTIAIDSDSIPELQGKHQASIFLQVTPFNGRLLIAEAASSGWTHQAQSSALTPMGVSDPSFDTEYWAELFSQTTNMAASRSYGEPVHQGNIGVPETTIPGDEGEGGEPDVTVPGQPGSSLLLRAAEQTSLTLAQGVSGLDQRWDASIHVSMPMNGPTSQKRVGTLRLVGPDGSIHGATAVNAGARGVFLQARLNHVYKGPAGAVRLELVLDPHDHWTIIDTLSASRSGLSWNPVPPAAGLWQDPAENIAGLLASFTGAGLSAREPNDRGLAYNGVAVSLGTAVTEPILLGSQMNVSRNFSITVRYRVVPPIGRTTFPSTTAGTISLGYTEVGTARSGTASQTMPHNPASSVQTVTLTASGISSSVTNRILIDLNINPARLDGTLVIESMTFTDDTQESDSPTGSPAGVTVARMLGRATDSTTGEHRWWSVATIVPGQSSTASRIGLGTNYTAAQPFEFEYTMPTLPSGKHPNRVQFEFGAVTSTAVQAMLHSVEFYDIHVERLSAGRLLVDGIVEARHITASESLSAKVGTFLKIGAGHILANAVTAGKIDFGSLSGEMITGLQIQTSSAAARGVKITTSGIQAFNSTGTRTFNLTRAGNLTVTGGTITGATFRTSTAANTGITLDRNGIQSYGDNGVLGFSVNSFNGGVYARGSFLTAANDGNYAQMAGNIAWGGRPGLRLHTGTSDQLQPGMFASGRGSVYGVPGGFLLYGRERTVDSSGRAEIILRPGGDFHMMQAFGTNQGVGIWKTGRYILLNGRTRWGAHSETDHTCHGDIPISSMSVTNTRGTLTYGRPAEKGTRYPFLSTHIATHGWDNYRSATASSYSRNASSFSYVLTLTNGGNGLSLWVYYQSVNA